MRVKHAATEPGHRIFDQEVIPFQRISYMLCWADTNMITKLRVGDAASEQMFFYKGAFINCKKSIKDFVC